MIITDRFVFLHIPKTGGTFVHRALESTIATDAELFIDTATEAGRRRLNVSDKHQTAREIPVEFRHFPVVWGVRNPYDHHVSLYEFSWWKTHPGDTFDEVAIRSRYPHFPQLTFDEYLESVYDYRLLDREYVGTETAARLAALDIGPLTFDYLRFIAPSEVELEEVLGAASWDSHYLVTRPRQHVLMMEDLNRMLHEFLLARGYDRDLVHPILKMERAYPAVGAPRRSSTDWKSYYSPSLLELVRQRERSLFEAFPGYDAG